LQGEVHRVRFAPMSDQSMRGFLAALEASGDLHRVPRPIDPCFEIAAVLSLRDRGPAQMFERVGAHSMPLVANLLNSRAR
jgi:2,5-furandicarboxylate decarboxylase 1